MGGNIAMTLKQEMKFFDLRIAANEVTYEAERAMQLWPAMQTAHHGYAVILEKLDELKEHVWTNQKKRDIQAMRKEAVQLAAMCLRFIADVCNEEHGR
jgi:expansin (peptidoglycan-binding protein)